MTHSFKIKKITLKNFIGIRNGLGKDELTIDFKKISNKSIIVILGENGTGKSTLASVLHALPGSTDKRNKIIIDDKEGLKKIQYERDDGVEFHCKIVYSPSKTGHNTKGYIRKITIDGDEEELNPNGNITSYKELIESELGLTDAVLKLANQNDVCKGHVDMTSTERKLNMATFLPEDIYSNYYQIVDKIYKEMKTRISVLVAALGKMHDEATIERELKVVTEKINDLVAKRDKCIGKIKEFETRIDILKDENIVKREKEIDSNIRSLNKELEKIADKLKTLYETKLISVLGSDSEKTSKRIAKIIDELKKQSQQTEIDISILVNSIDELRDKRNSINKDIQSKESILEDINTDLSLNELKKLLNEHKERFNYLDKIISKLDTNITKSDFMIGYEIVNTIRRMIEVIRDNDNDFIEIALNSSIKDIESILLELTAKKEKILQLRSNLETKITDLNSNSDLKDVLDKRPKNCTIDNCPFIENAQKWTIIEKELDTVTAGLDDCNKKIDKIDIEIDKYNSIYNILSKIDQLMSYINTNLPIINKLPYSEAYSTESAIKKVIKKGLSLLARSDDFDEFIEIIEFKDEYNNLKYKQIPSIENEIKIIETQGKFISSAKDDLKFLRESYNSIKDSITMKESQLEILKDTLDYTQSMLEALSLYHEGQSDYEVIYDDMKEAFEELKEVKKKLDELDSYKDKLKDKKERLIELDAQLQPLTRERELYKMEQLKIADHKQELASIEDDMYKCEIIRASLSVKDNGIPVSALEYFMDIVRSNANVMLSNAFNGSLYLEEFIINTKDFIIPYKKNGDYGMDVSYASSSERSFISLCLTLAIVEEIVSKYGIVILDEIDRGFSDNAKYKFIDILGTQIRRVGIQQVFMVSHNYSFYEGYDIGYICFPGSNLTNRDSSSVINIE